MQRAARALRPVGDGAEQRQADQADLDADRARVRRHVSDQDRDQEVEGDVREPEHRNGGGRLDRGDEAHHVKPSRVDPLPRDRQADEAGEDRRERQEVRLRLRRGSSRRVLGRATTATPMKPKPASVPKARASFGSTTSSPGVILGTRLHGPSRSLGWASRALPGRVLHRSRASAPRAPLHQPRPARLRPHQPAGDRQGRAVRALLALGRDAAPALPRRVRRRGAGHGAAVRRRRGRARRGAVRARLHRLRRRLHRPGRRRAPRLRVGLEHPHQGAPARPAGRLPRAVDPLHPLRPADGAGRRLPLLLATTSSAPSTPRRWTRSSATTRQGLETVLAWAAERWPRGDEPERAWRQLDPGQGARPAARAPARLDPQPRRHLRLGPGLRAAPAAPVRLAAAGGARVRRDDPRRAQAGDPELRRPGRAARPRRRVDRVPATAPRGHRARRRPPGPRPPRGGGRALGRAGPRRRHARPTCWPPRCTSRRAPARPRSAAGSTPSTRSSAPS